MRVIPLVIDEKKLEEYKNSLNSDVLQSERSEIEEIKLAAEIAVRDKDGKDAELKEKEKVRIDLNDTDSFNGYALFHYKKIRHGKNWTLRSKKQKRNLIWNLRQTPSAHICS